MALPPPVQRGLDGRTLRASFSEPSLVARSAVYVLVVLRRPISRGGTIEVRSFLFDRLSFPGSSSSKATRRWPLEAGLFFSRLHPSL